MDGECCFVLLHGKWRRCRCGSFWSLHGILFLGLAFILCVIEEEQEEELHDWVSRNFCCRGGARGEWVVKSLQIYWEKKKALKSVGQIWFWKSLWKQKKKKNKSKNSNNRNHERKQRLERRGFCGFEVSLWTSSLIGRCQVLLPSLGNLMMMSSFFFSLWGCCDLKLFVVILSVCILFSLRLSILAFFFSSRNSDLLPLGRWSSVMCALGRCCCNLIAGWALVDHYLLRRKLGLESFTVF